jgi:hypothetical protein
MVSNLQRCLTGTLSHLLTGKLSHLLPCASYYLPRSGAKFLYTGTSYYYYLPRSGAKFLVLGNTRPRPPLPRAHGPPEPASDSHHSHLQLGTHIHPSYIGKKITRPLVFALCLRAGGLFGPVWDFCILIADTGERLCSCCILIANTGDRLWAQMPGSLVPLGPLLGPQMTSNDLKVTSK